MITRIRTIDTETCGFEPDNQVVEIAYCDIVAYDPTGVASSWRLSEHASFLINPGRSIPPQASGIHHIVDRMVADAPRLEAILPAIFTGNKGSIAYCAHNRKFDTEAIKKSLGDSPYVDGFVAIDAWICSQRCATRQWQEAPDFKNQTLLYWLKLNDHPAFVRLVEQSGGLETHRALYDCLSTSAIMCHLLNNYETTAEELVKVSASPVLLPRFYFGEHALKPVREIPTSYLEWIVHKSKGPWDEDVMHTAKVILTEKRATTRSRSPV